MKKTSTTFSHDNACIVIWVVTLVLLYLVTGETNGCLLIGVPAFIGALFMGFNASRLSSEGIAATYTLIGFFGGSIAYLYIGMPIIKSMIFCLPAFTMLFVTAFCFVEPVTDTAEEAAKEAITEHTVVNADTPVEESITEPAVVNADAPVVDPVTNTAEEASKEAINKPIVVDADKKNEGTASKNSKNEMVLHILRAISRTAITAAITSAAILRYEKKHRD